MPIGLLLTPLIRQSISGHVPIALLDAPRPGTGKSLLAETVAMIATGRKAAMIAAPYDDDNEWRKRIASTLADGATIIVIDNVHGRLQSAALDLALTSHTMQERILGQSKNGLYAQTSHLDRHRQQHPAGWRHAQTLLLDPYGCAHR